MSTVAVEVVYRGIFQKTLARNIVRSIVFAARKEGKYGTAFGRYGDSPERNGIPAKQFAIVADDAEELEENLAVYEAQEVDVTINVDDTMCKGHRVLGLVRPSAHQRPHQARRDAYRYLAAGCRLPDRRHPPEGPALQYINRNLNPQLLRPLGVQGRPHRRPYPGRPGQGLPPVGQPGIHG